MRTFSCWSKGTFPIAILFIALVVSAMPTVAKADSSANPFSQLDWVEGTGQRMPMGGISTLSVPKGYWFLDGPNTQSYITESGSLPTFTEIGCIMPDDPEKNWIVYFEHEETGHISDDDKTKIDAGALLKSYKKGTNKANESLAVENQMYIDGWFVPPAYNESLRNLTWSLLAHDYLGGSIINYNVRMLTRVGYISAVLVSDPENLDADRAAFEQDILPGLATTPGNAYSDYNPSTDKKAGFGLSGLILGGAGLVAAKKAGLLATLLLFGKKFFIVLFAPLAILVKKLFRRAPAAPAQSYPQTAPPYPQSQPFPQSSPPNQEAQQINHWNQQQLMLQQEQWDQRPPILQQDLQDQQPPPILQQDLQDQQPSLQQPPSPGVSQPMLTILRDDDPFTR